MRRMLEIVLGAAFAGILLCSCQTSTPRDAYMKSNDIITYKPVSTTKTVVTIGKNMALNSGELESKLEAHFPNIDFVICESRAGDNEPCYTRLLGERGDLQDLIFTNSSAAFNNTYFYDMAGESITNRFDVLALNALTVDGKLYQLPITNDLNGIAYNKTLFEKYGWCVPKTLDEFYPLCATISAAGIRPFAPCFKYYSTIASTCLGFSYDSVLKNVETQGKYNVFVNQKGTCDGWLDPALQVLRTLYEKGYVVDADYASSATTVRKNYYAGKIAMFTVGTQIINFIEEEKPEGEFGFTGFPTASGSYFHSFYGNRLSLSRKSMEDSKKAALIRQVLDYLTTTEGQDILTQSLSGISALKGYEQAFTNTVYDDIKDALKNNRVFSGFSLPPTTSSKTIYPTLRGPAILPPSNRNSIASFQPIPSPISQARFLAKPPRTFRCLRLPF
jgi:raffinose/stachyose/melibiose transport system substrate-binding protein